MKNKIVWSILIIAVVVAGAYFLVGDKVDLNKEKENTLPARAVTHQVSQAEDVWPKILETTIDPLKVAVGETQKMKVIAQSPAGIKSVTANIETDNETTTVEFKKTGVDESAYVPRLEVEDNKVVGIKSIEEVNKIAREKKNDGVVSEAEASEPEREIWEGEWEVNDTHTKDYVTEFVAVDNEDRETSVRSIWLDPVCSIPISGNWNINEYGDCTLTDGIYGVAGGDVSIDSYTLTLGDGDSTESRFVVEGSLNLGSGNIAVSSDAVIDLSSTLYVNNNDGDSYPDSDKTNYITNESSRTARSGMASWTTDCNDWTADVYPNNPNWYTEEIDYCALDVCYTNQGYDYDCSGVEERYQTHRSACQQLVKSDSKEGIFSKILSKFRNQEVFATDNYNGWVGSVPDCGESQLWNSEWSQCGSQFQDTQQCH